jgi:hypothetical protein
MRVDYFEMHRAARRERAQAIGELIAAGIAWIVSHAPRLRHAARPHFAR